MKRKTILPLKRRFEERTNYRKRLALLKSKKPRVAARISNSNVSLQLIEYSGSDKTRLGYLSKNLEKAGWKHSKNSIPACYLSGLIFGKMCLKEGINEAVYDMGLAYNTKGNRYFAVLKGLVDSGLNIPAGEEKMPSEDRISGKHLHDSASKDFDKVKENVLKDYGN
jgi:large subunit ribosomal protein L18